MDKKPKKPTKVKKLKKKINLRKNKKNKTKSCDELKQEYRNNTLKKDLNDENYKNLLKCLEIENSRLQSDEHDYLYPTLNDAKFTEKLVIKKEFYDTKYEEHIEEDYDNIDSYAQKICDFTEFELDPHQMFVRNFMSNQTPYNGLLLYHGLGTGKTCSAISVCEETRTYMHQMGITKKIIIVASPAVQENFKIQLFDERKLKKINGLWNIKACIGNKFIKEINPMNMKGLSRKKIVRQIKKLIKQSYTFKGYTEFSNYIIQIMDKFTSRDDTPEIVEKKQNRALKMEFSNRMLVIDEVHNIRLTKEGAIKKSSENLSSLVKFAQNLKLLLLSATPMFDSHTEIVWILNLLNLNDKRYPIALNDIFNKNGDFKVETKDNEGGENLLIRKSKGYISYVRGENPFSFPHGIWPKMAGNPQSLFIKQEDGIFKYPEKQLNEHAIIEPISLIDLTLVKIGDYQKKGYTRLLDYLKTNKKTKNNKPVISESATGISFTALEAPLQSLNIIYPYTELEKDTLDEDMLNYLYGHQGLARVMRYNPKTKKDFAYKDVTLKNFGRIFAPENIGLYSSKIAYMCDRIRKSDGIVFIYSQYIDGGAIPIALALEEMGITRYGKSKSLFKTPPTASIDAITNKPKEKDKPFNPAKYIMITGDKKYREEEMAAVTDENNTNGEKVKIIIVSRAGSEGLDFKNIRQMHILDPWYNLNRSEQVIGRAVRKKSHCQLPYNKRNVEIYMYGTLLEDAENTEAVDLYIYRLAEKKAKKIATVTRLLKETAIDCFLNRKGLDFSESTIRRIAPNGNTVEQILSSNKKRINYVLGDKDNSMICDFKRCEYKCKPDITLLEEEINKDTYNESFIVMNLDKILQRIRNLFKEQYIYKKNKLLLAITSMKKYPLDQIYTALSYLIDDENEFMVDMLGRMGHLINIGDYYMFQPVELTDKTISRDERITPIPYKRKKITFILSELNEPVAVDVEKIVEQLENSLVKMNSLSKITNDNKNNWATIAAWAIHNLVEYNSKLFKLSKEDCRNEFLMLAMHHILDILNYEEKLLLLQNIDVIDKNIKKYIISYFDLFKISSGKYNGIIITNFNKKSKYSILTLNEEDKWEHNGAAIAGGLGREAINKFKINIDELNDKIGFMAQVKRYDTLFKIKNINLSSSGRPTKGFACEKGADKKILVTNINEVLNDVTGKNKYKMGATSGRGARSIMQIYNKKGKNILQHPRVESSKSGESKIDNTVTVKINAFQLCIEQELLFRYFDKLNKLDKRWFFTSVESIINNVEKIGK